MSTFFEENFLHWEKKFNRKFDYREIIVETRTLDSLKTSPDFIKIDVEGSERHVLKGAMKTIKKYALLGTQEIEIVLTFGSIIFM